ncbi:MAG: DUF2325 domain-containing protein [Nitrosospira sp.]
MPDYYLLQNATLRRSQRQPQRDSLRRRIRSALKEKYNFVIKQLFGNHQHAPPPECEEPSKKAPVDIGYPGTEWKSAVRPQESSNGIASLENRHVDSQKTRITCADGRVSLVKTSTSAYPTWRASDGSISAGKQSSCGNPNLGGLCILCVGGRAALYPAYRRLVETSGGNFLIYRGDPREKISYLLTLLSRADAVICPIDCVNHGVYFAVKRHCKRFGKPCALLKRSCLPTFRKGVAVLAAGTG